jgi:DNA-binding transcriptional regulator LsrR (DeoR family)
MTVSPDIEAEIRRLYFAEHWRRGTIATQLGLHDDVVKRVIGPTGRASGFLIIPR